MENEELSHVIGIRINKSYLISKNYYEIPLEVMDKIKFHWKNRKVRRFSKFEWFECEDDQNILQRDITSLHIWSVNNKMVFHPQKCKVLSVTLCNRTYYVLPFDRFAYSLDGIHLDYVKTEKDLGVHMTNKLNFKEHVHFICSKANRMLGLVKRTCEFVKNPAQKRVFYLSLVGSQFNH